MGSMNERMDALIEQLGDGAITLDEFRAAKEQLLKEKPATTPPAKEDSAVKEADDAKVWRRILYTIVLIPILFFGGCTALVIWGPKDDSKPSGGISDREVRNACQDAVKEQLKAPATAEFSGQSVAPTGINAWTVVGDVDSQNSFGAKCAQVSLATSRSRGKLGTPRSPWWSRQTFRSKPQLAQPINN